MTTNIAVPTDNRTLAAVEKAHVIDVVGRSATLDDAARTLGINIATLYRKRKQWGLVTAREVEE
jgi:DNA-binding NtrC family response regulator